MAEEPTPKSLAKRLLGIIEHDRNEVLLTLDSYIRGKHADPYMPDTADAEYKMLAKRSVSNWVPLLLATPTQALYVDGFRRGQQNETSTFKSTPLGITKSSVEMRHWQRSRLDARQHAIYRGALGYGHSFTVTELKKSKAITRGLSALRTAALFEDPANDLVPEVALTIVSKPSGTGENKKRGKALMWDDKRRYEVSYLGTNDVKSVTDIGPHGSEECPVTRFAANVDLEGRTTGVVEPIIPLQDRINQTHFDLLVAQTYGSFKVRWTTGMAPPVQRDEDGEVVLGDDGQPIPLPVNLNAKRFLFGEDSEVRFGSLDETPLDGYISSIDMHIRHLSAVSQTPPHHLLGQIANLSAEALTAAEVALQRKVQEYQSAFGEAWERVFRLAAELEEEPFEADDFSSEVLWRDMEGKSISQVADALGKLADQLQIPKKALWPRVPAVTSNELIEWERLAEEEQPEVATSQALKRASGGTTTSAIPRTPDQEVISA